MSRRTRSWFWGLIAVSLGLGWALLAIALLGGCCKTCPPPTERLVEVVKPCELPPPVVLPAAVPLASCPAPAVVCFDKTGAKAIALSLQNLKTWIKEVRAACGPGPATQPTSK
jgi:hypothetical protein